MKRDAPSAPRSPWARRSQTRAVSLREVATYDRAGGRARKPGSIGFSSLRGGDIVGDTR